MKIIVVGGGAAGMMAALIAKNDNNEVILVEKNEKLGKKLYITGKGRCNLTNACDTNEIFENIVTNSKFLYSSIYGFDNFRTIDFFNELGLNTKIERGNRVFPESDHSSDVISVLKNGLINKGVKILLNTQFKSVCIKSDCVKGIYIDNNEFLEADRVILALGGKSYPVCGADGDTWRVAKELEIATKAAEPALVPFVVKEDFVKDLQGLSLKNIALVVKYKGRVLYDGFGEMLFTHFGISGPLVLSASSFVKEDMYRDGVEAIIDFKPALDYKQLDNRLLRDFDENKNKNFSNSLNRLLPNRLIPIIINASGIEEHKKVNEISREERSRLLAVLKEFKLTVTGNRGFNEAIITRGGISVKEVNPSTMESKKYKGLYFAGEMLDVDALTGGFNLQIAWSSAYLAGESSAKTD